MEPNFLAMLQSLRSKMGIPFVINSGYRCEKHNKNVSPKAPNSRHRFGMAVDIKTSDWSSRDIFKFIYLASGMGQTGSPLGLGMYPKHIHIDLRHDHPICWVGSY